MFFNKPKQLEWIFDRDPSPNVEGYMPCKLVLIWNKQEKDWDITMAYWLGRSHKWHPTEIMTATEGWYDVYDFDRVAAWCNLPELSPSIKMYLKFWSK